MFWEIFQRVVENFFKIFKSTVKSQKRAFEFFLIFR